MVRVRVTTDEGVVMEVEAEPDDLEDALDVVVRVAEGHAGGGSAGASVGGSAEAPRPLLRSRLSPGQDPAESDEAEPAYSLTGV